MAEQPSSMSQADMALENAALRDEVTKLRTFIENMSALADALERVRKDADLHYLLSQVLAMASSAVRARESSLLVLDEDTNELVFVISRGSLEPNALAWKRLPSGEGIAGWVAQNRREIGRAHV